MPGLCSRSKKGDIMKKLYILLLLVSLFASCSGDLFDEPSTDELAIKLRSIWMVGGLSGNAHTTVVSAVDMYDPVTNTWYPSVTTLPTPVSFAGAVSIKISDNDHRIYVFGGFDSGGNVVSTVQYYTIETNTWASGTAISGARANIYATRLNNKIYVMGGTAVNASQPYGTQTTTYEYTPASDTWDTLTVLAAGGSERFMLASGSVVYHMGGRTVGTAPTLTTHYGLNMYVGATGTETGVTEQVLSAARTGIAGDVYESPYGDVMIIAGGFTTWTGTSLSSIILGLTGGTPTNLVQYLAFPFGEGPTWTGATGTFSSVGFGSAVVYYSQSLTPNYRFYYFGGTSSLSAASGQSGVTWCDLPSPPNAWNNTWVSAASMPNGRYAFTAVKIQQ